MAFCAASIEPGNEEGTIDELRQLFGRAQTDMPSDSLICRFGPKDELGIGARIRHGKFQKRVVHGKGVAAPIIGEPQTFSVLHHPELRGFTLRVGRTCYCGTDAGRVLEEF